MEVSNRPAIVLMSVGMLLTSACARVPKETVQLSYNIGQDLEQLHVGYSQAIRVSFGQIRKRGLTVIDEVWTPTYLNSFIEKGGLMEFAREGQTEAVAFWARTAVGSIDEKRRAFLDTLAIQETVLLARIDSAFGRVIRANAAVTAHLNSVLKVDDMQADVLNAAGLEGVRASINEGLVAASEWADSATNELEKAAAALKTPGGG